MCLVPASTPFHGRSLAYGQKAQLTRTATEVDAGGAQAAILQYAGGKANDPKKPTAGITGSAVAGHAIKIVGYGCGNDTVPVAISEMW